MTIIKGDLNTSWQFAGRKAKNGGFKRKRAGLRIEKGEERKRRLTEKQRGGKIRFDEITENVDIEYAASASGVKENIIIKSKLESYEFMFKFKLNGLKLRMSEDNRSVELYSISSVGGQSKEKVEFLIPSPFMFDANNERSDEVYYEIEQKNGEYILTVKADENWINDEKRAFPVTVDPQIITSESPYIKRYQYLDVYSYSSPYSLTCNEINSNNSSSIGMFSSHGGYYSISRAYYQINNIHQDNMIYKKAEIMLTQNYSSNSNDIIGLYKAELTYPYNFTNAILDYNFLDNPEGIYKFDITKLLDEQNPIFAIKFIDDNGYYTYFDSSVLIIYYQTVVGIDKDYSYQTIACGRAGTGYVNLKNGNLVFQHDDIVWSGNKMPVSISHVYGNIESEYSNKDMLVGNSWKINYDQKIIPYFSNLLSNYDFIYYDETGCEVYLKPKTDVSGDIYTDEKSLGYEYNSQTKILKRDGKTYMFNDNGLLFEIEDEYQNKLKIIIGGNIYNYIEKIIDGVGREFVFNQAIQPDNSYLLTSITDPDGREIGYEYDNSNNLIKINYPNGNSSSFDYLSGCFKAINNEGNLNRYEIDFDFNLNKVSSITEYHNAEEGRSAEYTYGGLTTKITHSVELESGAAGVLQTYYVFDRSGKVINSYMINPEDSSQKILTGESIYNEINPVYGDSSLKANYYANNLISSDHCFTNINSAWNLYNGNTNTGNYNLTIRSDDAFTGKSVSIEQNESLRRTESLATGLHTLSAYVKVSGVNVGGAYIAAFDNGGTELAASEMINETNGEFKRIHVTFNALSSANYEICLCNSSTDTALFSCVQLEKGSNANLYNMLVNSSFENGTSEWTVSNSNDIVVSIENCFHNDKTIKFNSVSEKKDRFAYQRVFINSSKDKLETFVLSACAKGNIARINTDRKFEMSARIRYEDSVKITSEHDEIHSVSFACNIEDWQYRTLTFEKKQYRAIEYIDIFLDCSGSTDEIYFDAVQLTPVSSQIVNESYFEYYDENLVPDNNAEQDIVADLRNKYVDNLITTAHCFSMYAYDNAAWDLYVNNVKDVANSPYKTMTGSGWIGNNRYLGSTVTNEKRTIQRNETLTAGTYTLSAYVRIVNYPSHTLELGSSGTKGAYISIGANKSSVLTATDNEIKRITLTVKDIAAGSYDIGLNLENAKGSVYFSCIQLEKDDIANKYNALVNGSFNNGADHWVINGNNASVINNVNTGNKSLMLNGSAYQRLYLYDYEDKLEKFILSGRAMAETAGITCERFEISARIRYWDSKKTVGAYDEIYCKSFLNSQNWQCREISFSKKQFRPVEYVDVYLTYTDKSNANNYALFECISLTVDNAETVDKDYFENLQKKENGAENGDAQNKSVVKKDDYGNILGSINYSDDNLEGIYKTCDYENDGNDLAAESDERLNKTIYINDTVKSRVKKIISPDKADVFYEYYENNITSGNNADKLKSISAEVGGVEIKTEYQYNHVGNINRINHNGFKYKITYNKYNLTSIKVNSDSLVEYGYTKNGSGRLKQTTYANGSVVEYKYNTLGGLINEKWIKNNVTEAEYDYIYDGEGNIISTVDIINQKVYNYIYENGNLDRWTENSFTSYLDGVISGKSVILSQNIVVTDKKKKFFYNLNGSISEYVIDGIETLTLPDNSKIKTEKDHLGRNEYRELTLKNGKLLTERHEYCEGAVDRGGFNNIPKKPTTSLISSITYEDGTIVEYEYDKAGHITLITENGYIKNRYSYDGIGRLVREDNVDFGKSFTFEYDAGGNILSKKTYQLTLSGTGELLEQKDYSYDVNWKDKLVDYDGTAITYDAGGNPLNYKGNTLVWEKGRQLKSYGANNYLYNGKGIRIKKNNTEYYLYNSDILYEKTGNDVTEYLYDNENKLIGFRYNCESYYYIKNLQGDIVKIADGECNVVAEYTYEAWGNHEIVIDVDGIGSLNPFRYRGYYYDVETNLYYLNSRYYDPETGRFINADEPMEVRSKIKVLNGCNIFAYCNNNPISYIDAFGNCYFGNSVVLMDKTVYPEYPSFPKLDDYERNYFKTMDEAAIDCAKFINPRTILDGWEYAATFYYLSNKNTKGYYYEQPYTNKEKGKVELRGYSSLLAFLHSHYRVAIFGLNERFSYKDTQVAEEYKIIAYLVTPKGYVKKYNYKTGKTTTLETKVYHNIKAYLFHSRCKSCVN